MKYLSSFVSEKKIGSLSKDVFDRRTSTGSEAFSLFIYLDSNKFVLLSFFSLIMGIYSTVSTKPLPNNAERLLPVEVRRSSNKRGHKISLHFFVLARVINIARAKSEAPINKFII